MARRKPSGSAVRAAEAELAALYQARSNLNLGIQDGLRNLIQNYIAECAGLMKRRRECLDTLSAHPLARRLLEDDSRFDMFPIGDRAIFDLGGMLVTYRRDGDDYKNYKGQGTTSSQHFPAAPPNQVHSPTLVLYDDIVSRELT